MSMNHLQRYLVEEFLEDYQEGQVTRRTALRLLAGIVGAAGAAQLLAACGRPAAPAATPAAPAAAADDRVSADDPAVKAAMVQFPGGDAQLMAYQARPASGGAAPVVLVCHENRGLTPYIQDVARRVAKAGYVGLAVDLLSRQGGTAAISDQSSIPGVLSAAPPERHVQDFKSGLDYLKGQAFAQADRAGMVGFCFGGGVTWLVAAGLPELRAAVPFYGPPPPASDVPAIKAAVLAIYGGRDSRITGTADAMKAAMAGAGKTLKQIVYPNADHAFHNDTGTRYDPAAAHDAWQQTLAWFTTYLRA
jgi:carboxymethylenebutenolidase